jgi:site-specific DNA-methyltransferase (adenine-specific)
MLTPTLGQVDAIVTDPPYHLVDMHARAKRSFAGNGDGSMARLAAGFMGKAWDGGDIAFRPETWASISEALKPGGYLLAFGGARTHHRIWCAIEDAGFVIQDTIMWLYGQGFPKGQAQLKPAFEPIIMAYKPAGKRSMQVDECRVPIPDGDSVPEFEHINKSSRNAYGDLGSSKRIKPGVRTLQVDECRIPTDGEDMGDPTRFRGIGANRTNGWDRPHKHETDEMAARAEAAQVRSQSLGRWPANVCHDGSDEVMEAFAAFGERSSGTFDGNRNTDKFRNIYGAFKGNRSEQGYDANSGSAARFFYCAKASKADRAGSKHPTVKPIALMRWLVRLVTPPGGIVLDPFAGSGTTGAAALAEGRNAILIEREPEYLADIKRRLKSLQIAKAA